MKSWHRYAIAMVGGLAVGLGAAWALTGGGLTGGAIVNGPWTTSLGYATKATDPITRYHQEWLLTCATGLARSPLG